MINKFLLLNFIIFGFLAASTGTAHAQFFIENAKVSLSVSGGERINKSVAISNTTDEEQKVKAYWEDFEYQPPYEGAKKFFPINTGISSSMSQWVSFSPVEFTIPAKGKKEIDYSISVPKDYTAGHYGVLFFERAGDPYKDATGVSIITRIGTLFFIEPKDVQRQATLENVKQNVASLSGEFHNKSTVILIPQITYYVMNNDGMVIDRGELKKLYVPQSAMAGWSIPLPTKLEPGTYSMVVNADLEEGNVVVKEIGLTQDPSGSLVIDASKD